MEVNTRFLDIIVKPEFKEYKEVCMMIRGKPYLVKVPIVEDGHYHHALAYTKIHYILEHPSPTKRGPKPKYKNMSEKNRANYQRRKARIAQTVA